MAANEIYANSFPLLADHDSPHYNWTDSVVTQGHADYCQEKGHAEVRKNGRCARCGDIVDEAPTQISTDLEYDPDKDLTDDEFRRYFPDTGDAALHRFSDEDIAHRYSMLYSRCVYDAGTGECVYCRRDDH